MSCRTILNFDPPWTSWINRKSNVLFYRPLKNMRRTSKKKGRGGSRASVSPPSHPHPGPRPPISLPPPPSRNGPADRAAEKNSGEGGGVFLITSASCQLIGFGSECKLQNNSLNILFSPSFSSSVSLLHSRWRCTPSAICNTYHPFPTPLGRELYCQHSVNNICQQ